VLTPFNLSYKIIDDVIVIDEKTEVESSTGGIQQAPPVPIKVTGKVTDETGLPFPGVGVK
jgi:protocatechuate 3,4-dioxygenase beta subunit